MFNFLERGFLATVGMLSLSREKTQEMVDEMIKRGEVSREEGKKLVDHMVRRGQEEQDALRKLVRQEVHTVFKELDVVTQSDLKELNGKLDALLQKLQGS